jgi:hypothetical protein
MTSWGGLHLLKIVGNHNYSLPHNKWGNSSPYCLSKKPIDE